MHIKCRTLTLVAINPDFLRTAFVQNDKLAFLWLKKHCGQHSCRLQLWFVRTYIQNSRRQGWKVSSHVPRRSQMMSLGRRISEVMCSGWSHHNPDLDKWCNMEEIKNYVMKTNSEIGNILKSRFCKQWRKIVLMQQPMVHPEPSKVPQSVSSFSPRYGNINFSDSQKRSYHYGKVGDSPEKERKWKENRVLLKWSWGINWDLKRWKNN